ncbi:hypothetical protein [Borrelia miyamotoi]|uniref:Protein BatD n=1 Tax=Borrelia miyamotoi TaxID=47466 RepID=A0AAQ2WVC0_9SPIR|nr:hypothetical protein [Borrelia miyamotoi]AGT27169.1 hypothetical protein I871_00925 [Borrelia miyamotoi LB-2001]AJA58363.1 hypothetical protein RJ61_00825 [Borrelia miyamotoi]AOW95440.1 hypothetical protein AXH25_00835 [Borrelia miyamotoi]QTL83324.1 hypothetical protein bmLB2001_000165 [Borrelia miyamotoi]WAZ85382.1 hypothetical protein O5400_03440 [Borrelia miyamotoi]
MRNTIVLFAFFLSFDLFSYELRNEIFIPTRYYVGDTVELKFSLILSEDEIFVPIEFEEIKNEFVEIKSLVYRPESGELIICFVSFYVGSNTLPRIYAGNVVNGNKFFKIILNNIKINTSKLVSDNDSLKIHDIEGVLFLPGTSTYLIIFLLALVLVPYLFINFLKFVKHLLVFLVMRHKLRKPYKVFQKQLVVLSNCVKNNEKQDVVYNLLNSSLRVYLSKKTGFNFNAITTTEISEILQSINVPYEICSIFINVFRLSDFSKFSGINLSGGNLSLVLEDLRKAAFNFDEFIRGDNVNI